MRKYTNINALKDIATLFLHIQSESNIQQHQDKLFTITNPIDFLSIINNKYYLSFLKASKPYLSLQDFSKLLGESWVWSENPNNDLNIPISLSTKWFLSADKASLMNQDEYQYYYHLPSVFTVYRGVTPGHNPNGLSWTQEFGEAKWFANRLGSGYVQKGVATKRNILAYFNRRSEDEIVINPKTLRKITII